MGAKSGRVKVFDWWTKSCRPILGMELPTLASMCGSFMTWFDKHGSVPREFECSLEVMRMWFPSDGEQLQAGTEDELVDLSVFACKAARDGSVELLAWMHGAAGPLDWRMIVNEANMHGHTHVLDWMLAAVSQEDFNEATRKYIHGFTQRDFGDSSPRCVCKGLHFATWKADRMDALMDWWMANAAGAILPSFDEAYRAGFVCIRQGYVSHLQSLFDANRIAPSWDLLIAGCESGRLDIVRLLHEQKCWEHKSVLVCSGCGTLRDAYVAASQSGSVAMLEWVDSIHPLDDIAISSGDLVPTCIVQCGARNAAKANAVHVLKWWLHKVKDHRTALSIFAEGYDQLDSHLQEACKSGNAEFVRFWASRLDAQALPKHLTSTCTVAANMAGHLDMLDYLLIVAPSAVKAAAKECVTEPPLGDPLPSLEWWKRHDLLPKLCPPEAIQLASGAGQVSVLDWWLRKSGLQFPRSPHAMDNASQRGQLQALEWWYAASISDGLQLVCSSAAVSQSWGFEVSGARRIQMLRWWAVRGFRFESSPPAPGPKGGRFMTGGNPIELDLLQQLGIPRGTIHIANCGLQQ